MTYLDILNAGFEKKRKERPKCSKNALSRDLGISGAFLSMVLTGKKDIPSGLALKICDKLNFDMFTKNDFFKKILLSKYEGSIFEKYLTEADPIKIETFLPLVDNKSQVLEKWYYIAILESLSCSNFKEDLNLIAKKLISKLKMLKKHF